MQQKRVNFHNQWERSSSRKRSNSRSSLQKSISEFEEFKARLSRRSYGL